MDDRLDDPFVSVGSCVVDMGDDKFTIGKPHPMIDYTERVKRIRAEAADARVGVFLMDVILGFGSSADPAGTLTPLISQCLAARQELRFVVHICGTQADKQGLDAQCQKFREAGAYVELDHTAAVEKALELLRDLDN